MPIMSFSCLLPFCTASAGPAMKFSTSRPGKYGLLLCLQEGCLLRRTVEYFSDCFALCMEIFRNQYKMYNWKKCRRGQPE
uniref:Secreted protein n=1 Tax=Salvator merianae TaxID=96440 RepID=A0A8D0DU25_SALMN